MSEIAAQTDSAVDYPEAKIISEDTQNCNYLIVVRKDEKSQRWVVDPDSEHILVDDGGNYPVQELQVHTIRALST